MLLLADQRQWLLTLIGWHLLAFLIWQVHGYGDALKRRQGRLALERLCEGCPAFCSHLVEAQTAKTGRQRCGPTSVSGC